MKISRLKFEVKQFDGRMNFNIWQSSMKDTFVISKRSKEMVDTRSCKHKKDHAKIEEGDVGLLRQVRSGSS